MASDRVCHWCGSELVVWGWSRLVHSDGGTWHVGHAMRRACKDHVGDCLDWQAACKESDLAADERHATGVAAADRNEQGQ